MKSNLFKILTAVCVIAAGWSITGCASQSTESGSDDSSADGADGTDGGSATDGTTGAAGTDGTDGAAGTDGNKNAVTCAAAKPLGVVSTPEADIIYQNNSVTATGTHVLGLGCTNSLDAIFEINGGCRLTLKFTTQNGAWKLSDGGFTGDTNCGAAFPESQKQAYVLDPETTNAAVMELPDAVDDAQATDSCATPKEKLNVVGWAGFKAGTHYMKMTFSGLAIKGQIHTVGGAGDCPKAFDACADGKMCGTNAYGYSCGDCTGGLECLNGYCDAKSSGCLPGGTGMAEGDKIANITWTDSENKQVSLHDFCGESAIWLIKTSGW